MPTLLIHGGTLIDPELGPDRRANLFVRDGRIAEITGGLPAADAAVDAGGAFVCPGFVDLHVHLREPGFEHKETIETGLRAAARGGFTAVAPMPNTQPVCDNPRTLQWILERARSAGKVRIHPIASITRGSRGSELADLVAMAALGCRMFSNDGQPVDDAETMLRAMTLVRRLDGVITDHCEDRSLTRGGVMHECAQAEKWGLPALSPLAEEVHIARDILLAGQTGCRLHIAHLSTARGLDLLRWAKGRRLPVTAEVTPHHFCLSVDDMPGPDPDFKMNPPLRSPEDVHALLKGLSDGDIDSIATDHAPHAPAEKQRGFREAPFGVVGLETAVPLIMDRLHHAGMMTMAQIVMACAVRPARILGTDPRSLAPGSAAHLTVIDPVQETTVSRDGFASRSRNTPFEGWRLRGAVRATIVDGAVVFGQNF
jgi:dihydroorotase